mgnify:CR=1 FL=1|tara:strand:- start:376 stop:705 length:330 start_codon:yes stop_codon:yes gene_type:complete
MSMSITAILNQLEEANPEALLLEPRLVYDSALVGITDTPKDDWPRTQKTWVAVYDTRKCLEAIMGWMECDYSEAQDWFGYNTSGAWAGEGTPTFVGVEEAHDPLGDHAT